MSRHIATTVAAAALAAVLISGAAAGSTPVEQPSANLTPPSISGEAQVRNRLTGSRGTWQGKALRYAYGWLRCGSNGAKCSGLSSPTAPSYTTSPTDASSTRRVLVAVSNKNGSAAAMSAAAKAQDEPLRASRGTWSRVTPMTSAYQWAWCESRGRGLCTSVAGAAETTHLLVAAGVTSTMPLSVTASSSAGSTTASAAATPPTAPTTGTVLRRINYEYPHAPGVNPSIAGWQCADNTASFGATRGTLTPDSSTFNSGAHSGRIVNPPTEPSAAYGRSACEVLTRHTAKTGNNIYYTLALRFPSTWSGRVATRRSRGVRTRGRVRWRGRSGTLHNTWAARAGVAALNYNSIPASGPLTVEAYSNRVALALASGSCASGVGCAYDNSCGGECLGHSNNVRCRPSCKIIPAGKLTLGVWHQIIIHVYETPYADGLVEVWWRRKGKSRWKKTVRMSRMPTVALGTNSFGHVFTAATYDAGTSDISDKFGLQDRDFSNSVSINQDDNCISTSFHAAVGCLG
jgi:Polysaccharide lyase